MRLTAAVLALLAGCSPAIEGTVLDAATDRPIADARVEIANSGWGVRNGQLVWDKEYRHAARSGADGQFLIKGVDGGHRLAVQADRYSPLETSLCSRSPMTVRVGGPFDGMDLARQLRIEVIDGGGSQGWQFEEHAAAQSADADLSLVSHREKGTVTLRAPSGIRFVSGTGNPPAPPQSAYVKELELDLLQCGWLFVRFEGGLAAVSTGSIATEELPEGGRSLLMSYGVAPA